jgi:hypothetical protein
MTDLQILLIGIGCAIAFGLYLVLCDRVRG